MRFLLVLGYLFSFFLLNAQKGDMSPIFLSNPSFEDLPSLGNPPSGWESCLLFPNETPVDVHPEEGNVFRVDKTAYKGSTYLGMVTRDNDTYESVSQRLKSPLRAGQCYEFSIYIAKSQYYESPSSSDPLGPKRNYVGPTKLRIFGGNFYCLTEEMLAQSRVITHTRWLKYDFRFEPQNDASYITFQVYYNNPVLVLTNGNILLDNASKIVPVPCVIEEIAEIDESKTNSEPVNKPKPITLDTKNDVTSIEPENQAPTNPRIGGFQGLSRDKIELNKVIVVENLNFEADSTTISPNSFEAMNELYDFLSENNNLKIEISGHTNSQPSHEYCDNISTLRAKEVADYLVDRGIRNSRITYVGHGKRRPKATNKTPEGRRKNQRVEIKITGYESS